VCVHECFVGGVSPGCSLGSSGGGVSLGLLPGCSGWFSVFSSFSLFSSLSSSSSLGLSSYSLVVLQLSKKFSICSCHVHVSFAVGSHSFRAACLLFRPFGKMLVMAFAKLLLHESWGAPGFLGLLIQAFRKSFG